MDIINELTGKVVKTIDTSPWLAKHHQDDECIVLKEGITAEEVLKAAKLINQTPKRVIEKALTDGGSGFKFRFGDDDQHFFALVKADNDQEIMIVSKEFAEDIREKYDGE